MSIPLPTLPYQELGKLLGKGTSEAIGGVFDFVMRALWTGALSLLRAAFKLADGFSTFDFDPDGGPVAAMWPLVLWISGVLALGLFFWQLITTVLRGGRGFTRLVGGPIQYGIALAVSVGIVATMLTGADALTDGILDAGLRADNFQDAIKHTSFGDAAIDGIKAVVIGALAIFAVIPAALGFVIEMLFRQAAIYVLVLTLPLTAAGLLSGTTASWFWRSARWIIALIMMKPVIALTVVLGVAVAGESDGLSGLLSGIGVLVIALLAPWVLFRLFAFIDPNTDVGASFRRSVARAGMAAAHPALAAAAAGAAADDSGGDITADTEAGNTDRFDTATSAAGGSSSPASDAPSTASDHPANAAPASQQTTEPGPAEGKSGTQHGSTEPGNDGNVDASRSSSDADGTAAALAGDAAPAAEAGPLPETEPPSPPATSAEGESPAPPRHRRRPPSRGGGRGDADPPDFDDGTVL